MVSMPAASVGARLGPNLVEGTPAKVFGSSCGSASLGQNGRDRQTLGEAEP